MVDFVHCTSPFLKIISNETWYNVVYHGKNGVVCTM